MKIIYNTIKMNTENSLSISYLSEGWVNFTRYNCKEGYIDRWLGDCADNPNFGAQCNYQLNSFSEYYRCNEGKWIPKHEFDRYFFHDMLEERELFDADEIFKTHLITI